MILNIHQTGFETDKKKTLTVAVMAFLKLWPQPNWTFGLDLKAASVPGINQLNWILNFAKQSDQTPELWDIYSLNLY